MLNNPSSSPRRGLSAQPLRHFVQRMDMLQDDDMFGAHDVLKEAYNAGASDSDMVMLCVRAAKSTKIDRAAFTSFVRTLSIRHVSGMLVTSPRDAVHVYKQRIAEVYDDHLATDGSLYVYRGVENADVGGTWTVLARLEREALLAELPAKLLRTEKDKDNIHNQAVADLHQQDAFADGAKGVGLQDVFLSFDQDDNTVTPNEYTPELLVRNKVPVFYDGSRKARRLKAKLLRAFGGDEIKLQAFLDFAACAIFGVMPAHDRQRTCFILVGPQRSGKSTMIDFLRSFIAADSHKTSLSPEHWNKPEKLIQLRGTLVNTLTELNAKKRLNGHSLKTVLSHEPVTGRLLYKDAATFTPRCLNLWACNTLPSIDEDHDSLLRRFIVVEMGPSLTDADLADDFGEILNEEAAGAVNLLVEAVQRVMARGRFELPAGSDEHVMHMQCGSDPVRLFVRAHVIADSAGRVTSDELWPIFRAFAERKGLDTSLITSGWFKVFSPLVTARCGAVRKVANGKVTYHGISLRDLPDDPGATGPTLDDH